MNDIIKKAIEEATIKAGGLPENVKEVLAPKPREYCDGRCGGGPTFATREISLPKSEPTEGLLSRKEAVWPVEPGQMSLWKLETEQAHRKRELFLQSLDTPEHLDSVREAGAASAQKKMSLKSQATPPREIVDKEPKLKKVPRQNRLGQTKLIDGLLRAGKNEKEIFAAVREQIPSYPADKLPKLIKLRQYHVTKK